ncbi:MAG: D-glycero-beta-D-manno-heptose 1-phosphate adenylyltransferase [Bacteroidia bacterium]|nr:D-glycero-beta-D-manno-heptose 1-phosphate adenylyltransferase [Bacteroidia bacterium]
MFSTQTKILSTTDAILATRNRWRFQEKKIVFTNGCFDILHLGHLQYLEQARSLGSVLVVGVNSDESVKRLKGNNRPIFPLEARLFALAALWFVDAVTFFEEDTPMQLIQLWQPDVLVKGGDYSIDSIVGADFVQQHGGLVTTIPLTPGFSTTNTIKKILEYV